MSFPQVGRLCGCASRHLTLATAGQGDLEAWLISEHALHRRDAGHFIRWANKQKLTSLDALAVRWDGPSPVIGTEARWEQARRLFHDESLKPEDRVAGLLVLLYAQWPAAISRLTLKHIQHRERGTVDIFAPEVVVWAYEGPPQQALPTLLNLVHPAHPDAPTAEYPAPPSLHIPRAKQRPMTIRPRHQAGPGSEPPGSPPT